MGREVRRVPPNWTHPEDGRGMFDQHIDDAMAEWKANVERIRSGNFDKWEEDYRDAPDPVSAYIDDYPEPDADDFRPWRDEEATWFQVWQTVSEGTPVTPAFEAPEELIEYLVAHGDFWDQQRGDGGWSRRSATSLVKAGWVPSAIIDSEGVHMSRDIVLPTSGESA